VKSRVDGSEIEFVRTNAVMSGSSVPKSPSEPESSARGCDLMVSKLCFWTRRSRDTGVDGNGMTFCKSLEIEEVRIKRREENLGKRYHEVGTTLKNVRVSNAGRRCTETGDVDNPSATRKTSQGQDARPRVVAFRQQAP
jgi:hypothetical protein